MITTKVKLFLLLVAVWIAGIFATLLFGRLLIALVSFFFIGQFDFPISDLVESITLAISGGILIGGIQCIMAKERTDPKIHPGKLGMATPADTKQGEEPDTGEHIAEEENVWRTKPQPNKPDADNMLSYLSKNR